MQSDSIDLQSTVDEEEEGNVDGEEQHRTKVRSVTEIDDDQAKRFRRRPGFRHSPRQSKRRQS